MSLAAWKDSAGVMHKGELVLMQDYPEEEVEEMEGVRDSIGAYSIFRMQVSIPDEKPADPEDYYRGLILEVRGECEDSDLENYANELQTPVVLKIKKLGTFTLDRSVNWYSSSTTTWMKKKVRLNLSLNGEDDLTPALDVAQALWADQEKWNTTILDYLATEMVELANDWVQEEDEEQTITEECLRSRVTLESISIDSDGSFEFWYEDDNIFGGHAIQVCCDLKDGPNHASIQG
ncbi:MAG TPA: DUF2262 domain-containing protein [Candidatus Methylacidiphilales bacterium]|nr:DUF2262 domain-containing protein [Candidatus Methylacidiphilales bacterium]